MRELLDRLTWLNEQGICHKLRKIYWLATMQRYDREFSRPSVHHTPSNLMLTYTDIKLLRKYLSECRDCIKIIVANLSLPGDKETNEGGTIACSYRANLICPAG